MKLRQFLKIIIAPFMVIPLYLLPLQAVGKVEKYWCVKCYSWEKKITMILKKILSITKVNYLLLFLLLLGTLGCCRVTALERDYGNSWAYNEAVQIADPNASLDQTPATGLNPQASTNVIGAYNKSFSGSKSGGGTSTTINLGGLTTAGGGGGN
jgi:hypothetical protein